MTRLIAACIALASLSLLLPSEPSYDPWAWLVWGRELAHLELDTRGGPSWKPLPVALLAMAAPLGELSVSLWMVIARAGALLALAMAFRLARRLAGGPKPLGATAGTVAAVALAVTPDWFQFTAHGSEAPLAVALMLWAVERHLDERPVHALALGAVVCLMRPELFPFLGLYAAWAGRAEARWRPALAAMLVAIPLAWVVPEWIGSGNPLDGGSQARSEPFWSLSHAERPWLRALERMHNHTGLALELLAAAALAAAAWRRDRAVLVLAGAAAAEATLFVAMTQAGFSGNPRYVLPALTIACVLAGVGAARAAEAGAAMAARAGRSGARPSRSGARPSRSGARPSRSGARVSQPAAHGALASRGVLSPAGAAVALLVVALVAAPLVSAQVERLGQEAREVGRRMELQRDLARAVEAAGGSAALRELGSATSNRALHTRLAWELGRPIQEVERGYGHRVVFRTRRERLAGEILVWGRAESRRPVASAGTFEVYRRTGLSYPLFTSSLQGFHIPHLGGRKATVRVVTR